MAHVTVSYTGNAVDSLIAVPRSIVAKLGDRFELECNLDTEDPVNWEFSSSGSLNSMVICQSGIITHGFEDKYAIDKSRTGQYNLIMNSVDLSFGGTYTCSDSDLSRSAELIVIGSSSVCLSHRRHYFV